MRIIPVIDLLAGQVVHAREGLRNSYRPINSPLCPSSDIVDVIEAFLSLYPFDTLYIADLDALRGGHHHDGLLAEVLQAYPGIRFWLDRGQVESEVLRQKPANYWPVLGSESLGDDWRIRLNALGSRGVLSLDFFGASPRGPETLFDDASLWPPQVILMTLGRVGSALGPDWPRLQSFQQRHPDTDWVAAGGVRDMQDLERLERMGVRQALLASALHSGAIGKEDLQGLASGLR